MDHKLDATPQTTVDVFSAELPPVLTIDPGDTLTVHSLDASGYLSPQTTPGEQQPKMFDEARGHCLTGPIAVRGAQPGDVLAIHLVSLTPDPWGWTVAGLCAADRDRPGQAVAACFVEHLRLLLTGSGLR